MDIVQFKILDLFSGAGGFSKGFEMIPGFTTVVASDFNEPALMTFHKNFPLSKIIFGDITSEKVKQAIVKNAVETKVNMIIGGPPCQGFSNKGKKLGLDDPRNFLFLEYLEMVNRLQPEVFVIENVKAMLTAVNGYFIKEIVDRINALGYKVNYSILSASNYGVPQNRQRAIIIAAKDKKIKMPVPTVGINNKTTVRDAISDLSYLNSGEGEMISQYRKPSESNYQTMMRANSGNILYNHIATSHSQIALDKLAMIPPEKGKEYLPRELWGNQKFKTTWGRLEWDKQSPTIDTRFDTPSNGKNSHPYLNRAITPREAARIQSFPDDFEFIGKKSHITKQIGNAVPPLMGKAIAETIKNQVK